MSLLIRPNLSPETREAILTGRKKEKEIGREKRVKVTEKDDWMETNDEWVRETREGRKRGSSHGERLEGGARRR